MKQAILAKMVYYNFRIYQHFCGENSLDNDSNSIDVESLMDYCENQIPKDDYDRLWKFVTQAY